MPSLPISAEVVTELSEATEEALADRWRDGAWLASAHEWITAQVEARGWQVAGPVDQVHVQPWATVLRVPTSGGTLWFKANAGSQAQEAAVVAVIASRCPDAVPPLLAVDVARAWFLMADGGTRLREVVEGERDLARWLDVLPAYARIQLAVAPDADALLLAGAPDRRLVTLPEQYARLVEVVVGVDLAERERLRLAGRWVEEACRSLTALGIPETIQHDDLHDGQVLLATDDRVLVFDWGDACVSHPFLTMAVTLEGVIAWGVDDVEGSEDLTPYRAAYLAPFASYGTPAELEAGLDLGLRLGWITRALDYHRTAAALGKIDTAAAVRLRMFLQGLEEA